MIYKTFIAAAVGAIGLTASAAQYYVVTPNATRSASQLANTQVTLSASQLPQGVVGVVYQGVDLKQLVSVTGDPGYTVDQVTWSIVGGTLPAGLTLNANGTITGTPTSATGSTGQSVTIQASYKTKSGSQTYTLVTLNVAVALAPAVLPQAFVGTPYAGVDLKDVLSVTGDPDYNGQGVTWSIAGGALPTGLTLNADGTITGTPTVATAAGGQSVTIKATYRTRSGQQTYKLTSLALNVALTSATLPEAVVGTPYEGFDLNSVLQVTGDPDFDGGQVTWRITAGTLPAGLVLNSNGTLSGTPTQATDAAGQGFEVTASYKTKSGARTYKVTALGISVSLSAATLPEGSVGDAYAGVDLNDVLTVSGDPGYKPASVVWELAGGTLPAGLTLNADGTITGTPSAATSQSGQAFQVKATYKTKSGVQTYKVIALAINVSLASATLPEGLVGVAYPTYDLKPLVSATGDASFSTSAVTWEIASGSLPAGLTLNANGTISGTPTAGTAQAGQSVTIKAVYKNKSGQQTYKLVALNINVSLSSATLPEGSVGSAYSYDLKSQLSVTGDNAYAPESVSWAVDSGTLPAGLSLNPATGVLSGTPTVSTGNGGASFAVKATYKTKSGVQTYKVIALNIGVSLASATLPDGEVGGAYSYDLKPLLTVNGDNTFTMGAVTWSVNSGTLPAGLTLNADGTLTGTPSASTGNAGQTFEVKASYKTKSGTQVYKVIALSINVSLASATLPEGSVGSAYSYDLKTALSVTGDSTYTPAQVTWTVDAGSLPAGLVLNADGTISGTPSASTGNGGASFTVKAAYKNKAGVQTYKVIALNIAVTLDTATLPEGLVGAVYPGFDLKTRLTVTGDSAYAPGSVSWSVVSGALPAGLTLNPDGTITGTPTAATAQAGADVTIKATYKTKSGQQAYKVVALNIAVSLAAATLPEGAVGSAYSYDLKSLVSATGDTAFTTGAVTWSVNSGTLPAGLTLNADGTITGTPSAATAQAGTSFDIKATYKTKNGVQTYKIVALNIAVSLAAATLPEGIVGNAYSYDLKPLVSASGDTGFSSSAVTWSLVSGTLPAGLSLNTATGVISGTPTAAAASSSITLRATYKNKSGQQTYQIVSLSISVALNSATLPEGQVGVAYAGYDLKPLVSVSGDAGYSSSAVTWSIDSGTLPAGLTLNSNGTITGTPTAATAQAGQTVTVRATYKTKSGAQTYTIIALNIAVTLSSATLTEAIVGSAYSYDLKPLVSATGDAGFSSSAVTWSLISGTLPAGLSLNTSTGVISGTPTAAAASSTITLRATYKNKSGQQSYQIVSLGITVSLGTATLPEGQVGVAYAGYDLKPLVTVTGDAGYSSSAVTWSIDSGTLPAGLTLNSNGTITGTPTAATAQAGQTVTVRATYKTKSGAQTYTVIALNISVSLATAALPEGQVGVAYPGFDLKTKLTVSGDTGFSTSAVTWTVDSGSLPAGLVLNSDGTISGTPTAATAQAGQTVNIKATYKNKSGVQTYTVIALNIAVTLGTATLPEGIVGNAYSYDLKPLVSASGDTGFSSSAVTWSLVSGTLPAGLSLNTATGVISGTPTAAAASSSITLRATYKNKSGQQNYQIVSLSISVALNSATLPEGQVGVAYAGYDLKPLVSVSGDAGYSSTAVTWSIDSGTLPAGLTLNSNGTISGTPTAATAQAGQTVTVRATYKTKSGAQTYTIIALNIAVTLSSATLTEAIVGSAYSYDLKPLVSATGDTGFSSSAVTWSLISGTLPAGLSLNTATGVISGTPTAAAASSTITLRATYKNKSGQQSYQIVSLGITVSLGAATLPEGQVGVAYAGYDLKPLVSVSGDAGYSSSAVTWSIDSGSLPAGLTLNSNGTITGTPTAATAQAGQTVTVRATYKTKSGAQTYTVIALNISVSLATATLPEGIVGNAYNYDLKPLVSATGDTAFTATAVTWSLVSGTLPPGLSLNATNGVISGTPTAAAANSTITLRATYKSKSGQQSYQILSLNLSVSLSTATLSDATVNAGYSYDFKPLLSVNGDSGYSVSSVTFSATGLPAGISMASNGILSGTPTATTSGQTINVTAAYKGKTGVQSYTLKVNSSSIFTFSPTISADTQNYNLRSAAIAAGWNGTTPINATVTISSGIVVSANSTSNYAFDTGSGFPAGSVLKLVNNGYILGMGGAGASPNLGTGDMLSGLNGQPGGAAFRAQYAINVTNTGTIGGGGGGGGSGGNGDDLLGCGVECGMFGGGGGGGRSGRTASAGGGYGGTAGTFASAGVGGGASSDAGDAAGAGGKGGGWGSAGIGGDAGEFGGTPGGSGGPGGAAVVGNAYVTWATPGTRLGAIQ